MKARVRARAREREKRERLCSLTPPPPPSLCGVCVFRSSSPSIPFPTRAGVEDSLALSCAVPLAADAERGGGGGAG